MVLAGTGKEGKTKEVVKDREGKMVCMYVCITISFVTCRRTHSRKRTVRMYQQQQSMALLLL